MKTKSLVSTGQRDQHAMKRKREQIQTLNFLSVFSCCSNVLICWFRLQRFATGVRPLVGAHPKMGPVIFVCLYIFMAGI